MSSAFRRFPLSAVTPGSHKVVAKNDRFEVTASKSRQGNRGARYYSITFNAIEVLDEVVPRKFREIELPVTIQSNLGKILVYLSKLS